jgi:hypothetical protein
MSRINSIRDQRRASALVERLHKLHCLIIERWKLLQQRTPGTQGHRIAATRLVSAEAKYDTVLTELRTLLG